MLRVALMMIVLFGVPALAAPPKLDQLYPAGGQRGAKVEVQAIGTFERWPAQVWASSPAIQVKAADKGKLNVEIAADAIPTMHWIRLHDAEGASVARPFLVGTLPEIAEKEPNNSPEVAQKLNATRIVINGKLEKSADVDVFAVELKKGQTFVAAMEAYRRLRSPMDGVLQILDGNGIVLAQGNDHFGFDPLIAYEALRDGTYFVRAFAFPTTPDSTVRFAGSDKFIYRLTLTDGPFVDHAFPPVIGRKGTTKVELIGWNLPASLKVQEVRSKEGASEAFIVDAILPSAASVSVMEENVIASSGPNDVLPIPSSVCGRIAKRRDAASYRFLGKKGQKAEWIAESATLGFDLDPVLRLYDAKGKMLAEAKSAKIGGDSQASYVFPDDSEVRVEVRDLTRQASARHAYRLKATLQEPDYALKIAADRFLQKAGQPLEIDVALEPRFGFKQPVELELVGYAGKTSTKAKDVKTLTLRLEPAKEAFAGPIRLVGRSKGLPDRAAIATIAELDRTTAELWLTVGK
ncbi:MAG: PPC domain-containing protein [Gemmataceae bacterium]|nr:PPC domain-containing protein [Gemmataceae bacterium]